MPMLTPHPLLHPPRPHGPSMPTLAPHPSLHPPHPCSHLTPHSIHRAPPGHLSPRSHLTPHSIYRASHLCPCSDHRLRHSCPPHPCLQPMPPLRPHHLCHSPHPSLHPPHTPAFAPQSMCSHLPSIPSHTCSWANTPSCRIQIQTPCLHACPFMHAPTNARGPRYTPCTCTSPFPHAHAVQHPTCGHCKAGWRWSLLPSRQGSLSDRYPCS